MGKRLLPLKTLAFLCFGIVIAQAEDDPYSKICTKEERNQESPTTATQKANIEQMEKLFKSLAKDLYTCSEIEKLQYVFNVVKTNQVNAPYDSCGSDYREKIKALHAEKSCTFTLELFADDAAPSANYSQVCTAEAQSQNDKASPAQKAHIARIENLFVLALRDGVADCNDIKGIKREMKDIKEKWKFEGEGPFHGCGPEFDERVKTLKSEALCYENDAGLSSGESGDTVSAPE